MIQKSRHDWSSPIVASSRLESMDISKFDFIVDSQLVVEKTSKQIEATI